MKKVTVVLLLLALFLVSCGEMNDNSSTDSIDISSVSSTESDISEDSYVFEESAIDTSSSGEDSSSVEEAVCRICYGVNTETAKVFEIKGEKAIELYDFMYERLQDAPVPTEEQSKKHLGIKVEDDTAPTEQPLHLTFYSGVEMPYYYDVYRDGFTTWNMIFMSSIRRNMLPEDTFDEIVKMAGINLD
ncbi:MAG: hypothetical protein IJC20_04165 [Clostridia bacterium]|nr:hypothetical protein [Clostridia bacterium]